MRSIVALLFVCAVSVHAQTIRFSGGMNFAASESMQGTVSSVVADGAGDYIVTQYPFADPTLALGFGLDVGFPLSERLGWYAGASLDLWSNETSEFYDATADLTRIGAEVGMSAILLHIGTGLDLVARAGLQANVYSGEIIVDYGAFGRYTTTVNPAFRLGANVQAGLAYTFKDSPLTIDLMGGYANGNLVGKSFTKPSASPNQELVEIELNDGTNPDDPNDTPRVISLWSVRLGVSFKW